MGALDDYFGLSATALKLRGQRMELIASNIANAATPNYKARDLDFSAVLQDAGASLNLARSSEGHIAGRGGAGASAEMLYRTPLQPSLDGNTVELASEQTAFAENAVAYETTLSILNGRIGTLMSAIKGE